MHYTVGLNQKTFNNQNKFFPYANRRRLDSDNRKYSRQIYGAGILPFYVKHKTIYFLLGKDPEGRWSDFGGRSEAQDRGRWDYTATREFYEETIGSVMDISSMLSRLQHRKNFVRVRGKTMNGSSYFMYVVRIHHKDAYRENFHSTMNFIRYSSQTDHGFVDRKYFEKTDVQWVSLETLYASIDDEDNCRTINYPLRKVFRKTLEDNLEQIKNFCYQFFYYGLRNKDNGENWRPEPNKVQEDDIDKLWKVTSDVGNSLEERV